MRLVVASELHFLEHEGAFFTETIGDYSFWASYLEVFAAVSVVARVKTVTQLPAKAQRVDGDSVAVAPLPDYLGPWQFLRTLPAVLARTKRAVGANAAYLLLIPGMVGTVMHGWLRLRRWPYAAQVGGDPQESLSPKTLRQRWAYWARPIAAYLLKRQCRSAVCINYVTKEYLQRRYPAKTPFRYHSSDVWLPDEILDQALAVSRRDRSEASSAEGNATRLLFVGSMAQRYKGLHVLLAAVQLCLRRGASLTLRVLGDGVYRSNYEQQARDLGLAERVQFLGQVPPGRPVFDEMQAADIFVMPSLTEGLPRAMLEAMACGLPCIGSKVGGIPELLADEDMVAPDDALGLARKIEEVARDPARQQRMRSRNRVVASGYRRAIMTEQRKAFWGKLAESTFQHMQRSGQVPSP